MRCALNKKHRKSCFLFLNRLFVDFERWHESVGGDLEENGDFQIKKCVAQDSSVPKVPKDEVPAPRRSSFLNSNTAHRGTGDA